MPLYACLDCGAISTSSRCPDHTRPHIYGRRHRSAREALRDTLPAPCAYGCGTMLDPDGPWVAAHVVDNEPDAGWVAACPPCNLRARGGLPVDERPEAAVL